MRKIIIFILVTLMLFALVSCRDNASNNGKQETLVVDGQSISKHTTIYADYATVSLCDVLSALGFELSWNGTDNASFYHDNIKYEICVSQKTLVREGANGNYLLCPPGNDSYVCEVVDDVLIVDNNTLHCLFHTFINYPIDISVDYENHLVTITSKEL